MIDFTGWSDSSGRPTPHQGITVKQHRGHCSSDRVREIRWFERRKRCRSAPADHRDQVSARGGARPSQLPQPWPSTNSQRLRDSSSGLPATATSSNSRWTMQTLWGRREDSTWFSRGARTTSSRSTAIGSNRGSGTSYRPGHSTRIRLLLIPIHLGTLPGFWIWSGSRIS